MSLTSGVAHLVHVTEHHGVANANAQAGCELLGNDKGVSVKGNLFVRGAAPQRHCALKGRRVLGHNHAHTQRVCGVAAGGRVHGDLLHAVLARHLASRGKDILHGSHVLIGRAVLDTHGGVVVNDGPVLAVDNVPDGVVEAKAHQKQRRAARHPCHRHGKAALVAEHVAASDLPREREPVPERTDAFEKNSLSRLGRQRKHELGGRLAQARDHGTPGGNKRHANANAT